MDEEHDPRVYFAAERTLLAWVRTGLTVIGLGFVVARFGLFLRILRNRPDASSHLGSTMIGVGLVFLGSLAIGLAAFQHFQFCRELKLSGKPRNYMISWSIRFAMALCIVGIALALYMLLQSNGIAGNEATAIEQQKL